MSMTAEQAQREFQRILQEMRDLRIALVAIVQKYGTKSPAGVPTIEVSGSFVATQCDDIDIAIYFDHTTGSLKVTV